MRLHSRLSPSLLPLFVLTLAVSGCSDDGETNPVLPGPTGSQPTVAPTGPTTVTPTTVAPSPTTSGTVAPNPTTPGTVTPSPSTVGPTGGTVGPTGGTVGPTGGTVGPTGGTGGPTGGTGGAGGLMGGGGGTTDDTGDTTDGTGDATESSDMTDDTADTTSDTGDTTDDPGDTTSGEPVDCDLPDLPDAGSLNYENQKLPDPFTFFDGTKVTTKAQWECRRQEILAMAAKYLYGPVPSKPDMVTGTVSGATVTMNVTAGGKMESFTANINGSGAAIALNLSAGVVPQGSKSLSFGSGYEGKIRNLFGLSELNPNIANGWMIDRVMDVLEQNPDSGHDPKKMVVSGCSGCGKGAFLAGVFSRVPVTVIVESGGGGATSWRMSEWFRNGDGRSSWQCGDAPQDIGNLERDGICGPWVTGAAQPFENQTSRVYNMPFDQHLLLATIAPRYLVHFTNNNGPNSWCHLAGTSEALASWAAKPVFKALGVPERHGFSMYSANHCGASGTATALAGEMFKLAFDGDTSANTDVMDIPSDGVQQPVSEWEAMWIDWDMDTVLE